MEPKYPKIKVKLTGKNGNAWNLLGLVGGALRKGNAPKEEISLFTTEATAGDYNNLLRTCMAWVNVT